MILSDKIRSAQIRADDPLQYLPRRELGLVTDEKPKQQVSTFSMRPVRYEDGSFCVEVTVTGLVSEQQAEAVINHMQKLFCGAEIAAH